MCRKYEVINLKVIHRRNATGFEQVSRAGFGGHFSVGRVGGQGGIWVLLKLFKSAESTLGSSKEQPLHSPACLLYAAAASAAYG